LGAYVHAQCAAGTDDARVGVSGVAPPIVETNKVKGICRVCRTPVFVDQARSKNQLGAYVHAQCVAEEMVEGLFPADIQSGAFPSSSQLHAALSRAEEAETELRTLKALLAEPDDTLQQHFVEWQELDGFLQSLRKMGDKALRKEFNTFSDVYKEAFTDVMGEEHGNKDQNPLRISKQRLATLLAAKNVVLSKVQVDELV
jgi:hypothetical protein